MDGKVVLKWLDELEFPNDVGSEVVFTGPPEVVEHSVMCVLHQADASDYEVLIIYTSNVDLGEWANKYFGGQRLD